VKNIFLLYVNSLSQFHICKNVHLYFLWFELILQLSSQHDAGSYLRGTFYGFVVHPGFKLCHLFLSLAVFFDDCRCFRHHQVLEGDWPDHAGDNVPRPGTLSLLLYLSLQSPLPLPTRPLPSLFPRTSLFLLSGYNIFCLTRVYNLYRHCLIFPDSIKNTSSNYFRFNIRTGNNSYHRRQCQIRYRLILHSRSRESFAEL